MPRRKNSEILAEQKAKEEKREALIQEVINDKQKTLEDAGIVPVKLSDLIEEVKKFNLGEIVPSEFDDFCSKITVRSYIPSEEKLRIVLSIVTEEEIDVTEIMELKSAEIQKKLFFNVLLNGYALIDLEEEKGLCTYENMDLLIPVVEIYLMQFCAFDYSRIKDMVKDSITLYGVKNVADLLSNIDPDKAKQTKDETEALFEYVRNNKEIIDEVKEIIKADASKKKKTKKEVELSKEDAAEGGKS